MHVDNIYLGICSFIYFGKEPTCSSCVLTICKFNNAKSRILVLIMQVFVHCLSFTEQI